MFHALSILLTQTYFPLSEIETGMTFHSVTVVPVANDVLTLHVVLVVNT